MILSHHWSKIKLLTATFAVTATLSACSTGVSNPLDSLTGDYKYAPDYIKTNVITSKSTKGDIRQKFGAPYSVEENPADNTARWVYDRSKSSLNTLMDMASKYSARYGDGGVASQIMEGKSQVATAQEAMADARSLSGTNAGGQYANIRMLYINFKGDVVQGYTTY